MHILSPGKQTLEYIVWLVTVAARLFWGGGRVPQILPNVLYLSISAAVHRLNVKFQTVNITFLSWSFKNLKTLKFENSDMKLKILKYTNFEPEILHFKSWNLKFWNYIVMIIKVINCEMYRQKYYSSKYVIVTFEVWHFKGRVYSFII